MYGKPLPAYHLNLYEILSLLIAISRLSFVLGITGNRTKFNLTDQDISIPTQDMPQGTTHLKRTKQTRDLLTTSGEVQVVTTTTDRVINKSIVINLQAPQPNVDITRKGGLEANDTGKIIMILILATMILVELIIILNVTIVIIPKGIIMITVMVIFILIITVNMVGNMKHMQALVDLEEVERTLTGEIT